VEKTREGRTAEAAAREPAGEAIADLDLRGASSAPEAFHETRLQEPALLRGLAPATRPDARILILGSLPGPTSLSVQAYYGHPGNRFWPVMETLLGTPLVGKPHAERVAALQNAGVGLWDVAGRAHRQGPSDAMLRSVERNDVPALLKGLPGLRVIGFNGAMAWTLAGAWRHTLEETGTAPVLIRLPSTSRASRLPTSIVLNAWMALADWL
jgi:double-stranded uracil-DNA glycosylase